MNLIAEALSTEWKIIKKSEKQQFNTILTCTTHPFVGTFMDCKIDIFRLKKNIPPEFLKNAKILLKGGMPAHQHGLPTTPITTWLESESTFIIQGLKFSMPGDWFLSFYIIDEEEKREDEVIFAFTL